MNTFVNKILTDFARLINGRSWFLLLPLVSVSCTGLTSNRKTLDLKAFEISVPKEWNYKKEQGIDSFVGEIEGPKCSFSFDYSGMGYASNLLPTEKEFLEERRWMRECYFCKSGITYSGHIPDDDAKRTIHAPTKSQKDKFPKADYIADLTLKDSTIYIPIELTAEIKNHNIQVDSNSQYVFKTIWPKVPGRGMTGIYIHSRKTTFNFQINGENLSLENQQQALAAFKTIHFK